MTADPSATLRWAPLAAKGRVPILLVRHGQTAWNVEGRFLGCSDIPLDPEGLSQVARLADWLAPMELQRIHSSPLSRAWATAEALQRDRPGQEVRPWPGLAELNQGELEGQHGSVLRDKHRDFFRAWAADPSQVRVPGGETLGECQDRAMAALRAIVSTSQPGPPVVVVSHKMLISAVICEILELPLRCHRLVGQANTAVNLLSHGSDGFALHRLNEASHLDPG